MEDAGRACVKGKKNHPTCIFLYTCSHKKITIKANYPVSMQIHSIQPTGDENTPLLNLLARKPLLLYITPSIH
jgi:hypothetical protein